MTVPISVSSDGERVILSVDGKKVRLSKDAAFRLSEKLKSSALKAGENDWADIFRGFPDIWQNETRYK